MFHRIAYGIPLHLDFVLNGNRPIMMTSKTGDEFHGNGNREEGFAFVELLKSCAKKKDLHKGSSIHADILKRGLLRRSPHIASALINMYAKCGALEKAQKIFDELPTRNVVSWNALIAGYAQQGQGHQAINCFQRMQRAGLSPDGVTFTCILKACGSARAIETGKDVHDEIVRKGYLEKNIVLGNALVDMYAKCGLLAKAKQVLEELPIRNVVSWSALIAGYANEGQGYDALKCLDQMQGEGLSPNDVTFICILKACGSIRAIDKGKQIHDDIVGQDMLRKNAVLCTALVDMYAKCGAFSKAQQVLEELSVPEVAAWNALIAGYAQSGHGHEALTCYVEMQRQGFTPNEITFSSVSKACASKRDIEKGKEIHEEILSRGFLQRSVVIGTALVDMYAKCGVLIKAQEVLRELPVRDIVCWNALIAGYIQEERGHEALNCFTEMQREGFAPNDVTFISILKACGSVNDIDRGKEIHKQIHAGGLLQKNVILGTALVDMYVKCGLLAKAQKVVEDLPLKNVVTWNALIAGYAKEELSHQAFNCFAEMQREGHAPNEVTFACVLKACGNIGAADKGKEVHKLIVNGDFLGKHTELGTALVDMYARCGLFVKAQEVLKALPVQAVASWNALIAGFSQRGYCDEALNCFKEMKREGLSPNEATFVSVLNVFCHSKKWNEAQIYYESMSEEYGIIPKLEHHTCMVVALGRVGRFDKAMSVIKTMPCSDDPTVWIALLDACRKWGNVNIARLVFDQAIQQNYDVATVYVLMAKIYIAAGMQEEAKEVETMKMKMLQEMEQ